MSEPQPINKRKRRTSSPNTTKSKLQVALEHAMQCPGGVQRTLDLLRSASKADLALIRTTNNWSPLPAVIHWAGATYTRRVGSRIPRSLLPTLLEVCQVWHQDCGMSVDSGSALLHGAGEHFYRPLVLAAYYGFVGLVETLLHLGATPDVCDGEGRTAWYAALQNPANQPRVLRDCDRHVADLLWQRGLVTTDLGEWRKQGGNLMYMNCDSRQGSALLSAIGTSQQQLNMDVVEFLLGHGAVITDRDFLTLMHKRHGQQQLIHVVTNLLAKKNDVATYHSDSRKKKKDRDTPGNSMRDPSKQNQHQLLHCWSPEIDWSFPPTWKVAVALSSHCGLPEALFNEYVIPFLSRDWFYTPEQRHDAELLPARLGASLGQDCRNLASRSVLWKGDTC